MREGREVWREDMKDIRREFEGWREGEWKGRRGLIWMKREKGRVHEVSSTKPYISLCVHANM